MFPPPHPHTHIDPWWGVSIHLFTINVSITSFAPLVSKLFSESQDPSDPSCPHLIPRSAPLLLCISFVLLSFRIVFVNPHPTGRYERYMYYLFGFTKQGFNLWLARFGHQPFDSSPTELVPPAGHLPTHLDGAANTSIKPQFILWWVSSAAVCKHIPGGC